MKGTSVPLRVYFSGAIMPIKKTATQHPRNSQRRFTKNEPARTKQYLLCKTKPISGDLLMTVTSALTSTYEHKPPLGLPKNKANSKPIGKKAATLAKLHQTRATSSELRSSVPIRRLWPGFLSCRPPRAHKTTPFMQNKANFRRHDNDCNLSYNKHLRRKTTPGGAKKQSQLAKSPK